MNNNFDAHQVIYGSFDTEGFTFRAVNEEGQDTGYITWEAQKNVVPKNVGDGGIFEFEGDKNDDKTRAYALLATATTLMAANIFHVPL